MTLPHPAELACFDVDAAATVKRLASVTASCPLPPGLLPAASAPPSALDAISTTGAHPIKRSASGAHPKPESLSFCRVSLLRFDLVRCCSGQYVPCIQLIARFTTYRVVS